MRIHVAEIVGRRAGKTGHRAEFDRIAFLRLPVLSATQRRFADFGREELVDFGQQKRQLALVHHVGNTVDVVDRERLAPVALTAEDGIAKAIVYLHFAYTFLGDEFLCGGYGVLNLHSVETKLFAAAVDHSSALGVEALFADVGALNQRDNRQVEFAGESIVAAVVGRNCHDSSGSVAGKHVVAYPNWNLFARERVDGVGTGEHSGYFLVDHALALRLVADALLILLDCCALLGSSDHIDIFAFGSKNHERYAKHRVGTCGEYFQLHVAVGDGEAHLSALRAANPVALGFFERVGPVDSIESVEQTLSVGRNAQTPLIHQLLFNGVAAANRNAFAHLVVGQHRAEFRTPVDHRVAKIGYAIVHQHVAALLFVHSLPLIGRERHLFAAGCMNALGSVSFEMLLKVGYRHSLVGLRIVVGVEHLYECPLCPLIIIGRAGAHFAIPVVAETNFVELRTVAVDVVDGSNLGMLPGLDCILLGGESVGIVAHRVKHIESAQTFVARENVGGNVTEGVTDVQPCSRGVGEHVEHIEFRALGVDFSAVGMVIFPILLPALLYIFVVIFHIKCYSLLYIR